MKEKDKSKKGEAKTTSKSLNQKIGFYIMAIGILIPVIVLMGTMTVLNFSEPVKYNSNSNTNNSSNNNDDKDDKDDLHPTEEDLIHQFGFSKEDAINLIKEVYNSDNYEFEAVITSDNKYEVTARDPEVNTASVFIVDPGTGIYSIK